MISQSNILDSVNQLPVISDSLAKLQALMEDPTVGAAEFEKVILPDPVLTVSLLKLANSAFFGCPRKIETVRQAIAMLGMKQVFEMALMEQYSKTLPSEMPIYEMKLSDFWRHCISVGVISKNLAYRQKVKNSDFSFVAGLLHDMGKIAIFSYLMDESQTFLSCLRDRRMLSVDAEMEVLGIDHAKVGGIICEKWNIPDLIKDCALYHHAPDSYPNPENQWVIDIVHVADGFAHAMGLGSDVAELSREIQSGAASRLEIDVRTMESVSSEVVDEISELCSVMNKKPGEIQ